MVNSLLFSLFITASMTDAKVDSLSLDDDNSGSIKLISKDNKEFVLDKRYACVSNLVKTSMDSDPSATDLPMPSVKGDILAKVVEYLLYHKGVEPAIPEKPLRSNVMKDVCKDPWDAEFIDRIAEQKQQLYDLILAANYMDIKSLLHLGCAKVASLIKGQPLDKIKDILSKGTKSEGKETAAAAAAITGNTASMTKEETKK